MYFRDRVDAGRQLAEALQRYATDDPVILALPRGGVPVGEQVARALGAPLDVIVVRKLGVPFQPELGMGAIGEDDVRVLNPEIVRMTRVSERDIAEVERRERGEIERRAARFRGDQPMIPLTDRTAIIVDDGVATGGTARAAIQVARAHGARKVVLAVPVGAGDTLTDLRREADDVVTLHSPDNFIAVGYWYQDFSQTADEEVVDILTRSREMAGARNPDQQSVPPIDSEVTITDATAQLAGHLTVPPDAIGVVVFAHGSGSSRHSSRNIAVAGALQRARLGTLLFDLLTEGEAVSRSNVFDIELLARRLNDATDWLRGQDGLGRLPVGYFGASTGAAAALWAASDRADIAAVVSRGGRPDLAMPRLRRVQAPTLLIVGSRDEVVLDLNRLAADELDCERQVSIVPGATHLFEEPGTLDQAAGLARDWFVRHLSAVAAR